MANKNKKAGANHFALLETDDPGDTRLEQPQAAPSSLTQELFGRAYPSAWEIMRNRQEQQYSASPANAKARADSKKGAQGQGSSARKQQGGRHANGAAVNDDDAPAPRLYDLAEFPSLK
ncbi:unnamed protein product [Miscanthus lutarioriparius]|uniref:Uncharacterized protein n=1 Tax=Miscanthus lutarioriparius TaxID=422564 RepID=A0A811R0H8_9POAL|nr:unnamed protein product [Miscanthus lutarioriparius]